ncbi:hypothetical protein ACH5RR_018259 [Cinchona calisaya]|uniref:Uncharacterized protein n=1 Tax=Cinchona calisaya TaxID=153742 RepID=A0ABD2ZPK1_9GENT
MKTELSIGVEQGELGSGGEKKNTSVESLLMYMSELPHLSHRLGSNSQHVEQLELIESQGGRKFVRFKEGLDIYLRSTLLQDSMVMLLEIEVLVMVCFLLLLSLVEAVIFLFKAALLAGTVFGTSSLQEMFAESERESHLMSGQCLTHWLEPSSSVLDDGYSAALYARLLDPSTTSSNYKDEDRAKHRRRARFKEGLDNYLRSTLLQDSMVMLLEIEVLVMVCFLLLLSLVEAVIFLFKAALLAGTVFGTSSLQEMFAESERESHLMSGQCLTRWLEPSSSVLDDGYSAALYAMLLDPSTTSSNYKDEDRAKHRRRASLVEAVIFLFKAALLAGTVFGTSSLQEMFSESERESHLMSGQCLTRWECSVIEPSAARAVTCQSVDKYLAQKPYPAKPAKEASFCSSNSPPPAEKGKVGTIGIEVDLLSTTSLADKGKAIVSPIPGEKFILGWSFTKNAYAYSMKNALEFLGFVFPLKEMAYTEQISDEKLCTRGALGFITGDICL